MIEGDELDPTKPSHQRASIITSFIVILKSSCLLSIDDTLTGLVLVKGTINPAVVYWTLIAIWIYFSARFLEHIFIVGNWELLKKARLEEALKVVRTAKEKVDEASRVQKSTEREIETKKQKHPQGESEAITKLENALKKHKENVADEEFAFERSKIGIKTSEFLRFSIFYGAPLGLCFTASILFVGSLICALTSNACDLCSLTCTVSGTGGGGG